MSEKQSRPAEAAVSSRYLPVMMLLFVGSGCAALIYEIVWFQLLQLSIGISAVSLAVVLGTFMGGMFLGSLGLARVVSRQPHPMRVYAYLEAGIGLFGLLELFLLPYAGGWYSAIGAHGVVGVVLRALFCVVALLPPTLMMGATLPAVARWIETTPRGVSWMGFFYGGNTAGAVLGCLVAGFFLLPRYDVATATYFAVALNVVVVVIALGLARVTPYSPTADDPLAPAGPLIAPGTWPVYLTIAVSGMAALGSEVVWTRLLGLILGQTTYTFSIILAVFLLGIGLGSSAGSFAARTIKRPRLALGITQLLLVLSLSVSAYLITQGLPYWPINPGLSIRPIFLYQLDFAICVVTILPAACLWGLSFPLALAAVARGEADGGKLVGKVYAANTVGAILGAVGFALIVIPTMGTQAAQRSLIVLALVAALIILIPYAVAGLSSIAGDEPDVVGSRTPAAVGLTAAIFVTLWLASTVKTVPFDLIAYGRQMVTRMNVVSEVYRGEGMIASIGVSREAGGYLNYHSQGKVQASSLPQDMRIERMLAAVPLLLHPNPARVLNVGFGAGVTAGTFSVSPRVQKLTVVELEPLVPKHVGPLFAEQNNGVLYNPRAEIVIDDARHYVITSKEKFDVITQDPLDAWVKGTAALYTKEYLEIVKQHLKPGGILSQWVHLYETNEETLKTVLATFFSVFPNATVWGNTNNGEGYDLVVVGTLEPVQWNVDSLQARFVADGPFAATMTAVGFESAYHLLGTYGGRAQDLAPWLADAQINRDRNFRMQYLGGTGLNFYQAGPLYRTMLGYRRWPDDLIVGSEEGKNRVRDAMRSPY